MLKKFLSLLLIGAIITSCNKEEINTLEQQPSLLVSKDEIEELVIQELSKGKVFQWTKASDDVIWSAGMHSDSIFSIGYAPSAGFDMEKNIHTIDLESNEWIKIKTELEEYIVDMESQARGEKVTIEDLSPYGAKSDLPHIIVQLTNAQLIKDLRSNEQVRFVEPLGFNFEDEHVSQKDEHASQRSNEGCDGSPDYNINSNDYTTISPNTKMPWNFPVHNINTAWDQSQGDNIRIAVLDTGASDSQDNLGNQFTSGDSHGRNIIKESTIYSGSWWWRSLDSPHDDCGHGTSMAGFAAAPKGNDGNATGVAYKSDLITINCTQDVLISSSNERVGVRDALIMAGNRSDTKIISMSIGSPFSSSTVSDGIYYAYNNGKLIFAAAGTSFSWTSWFGVIFPANMAQTTAITGIKDGSNIEKCETCHSGSEVDFVIVMERVNDSDRASLSLASSTDQAKYTGGSSCGTATTAGIAALVWAENPSATRAQVLQALKEASHFYPSKSNEFGWGKIDALQAINNL